jgi:GMP synthase (glutamine-hydrolysing)
MALDIHAHRILILDFGSQYTQLIARRVREIGVYCELHPFDMDDEAIREFARAASSSPAARVGPRSQQPARAAGRVRPGRAGAGHLLRHADHGRAMGGKVEGSELREFGYARVDVVGKSRLLDGIEDHVDDDGHFGLDVWMSHGDKVTQMPGNFNLASTPSCPIAGMADEPGLLRRAVPPGSDPHQAGRPHPVALRPRHLRL